MDDQPFSRRAWAKLAQTIQGTLQHRPPGWVLKEAFEVEGRYEDCRVRGWRVGSDGPATLEMNGRGGRGLHMTIRNALHTGGEPLTGDPKFDDEVDWEVSHRGYANVWLGAQARAALANAEYWEIRFDSGTLRATSRRGTFASALHAMSLLALRGVELGEQWASLADALGGSSQRRVLNLGSVAPIELLHGDVHVTLRVELEPRHAVSTRLHAKASHSRARLQPADLPEGELLEGAPGEARVRLDGFVLDTRRIEALIDAVVRALMPANPYRS